MHYGGLANCCIEITKYSMCGAHITFHSNVIFCSCNLTASSMSRETKFASFYYSLIFTMSMPKLVDLNNVILKQSKV